MDALNIGNICKGAVMEVFERAMADIAKNIKDPNTDEKATRKLTIEFTLKPFADRSGAEVSFRCKTGLQSVSPVTGTIFISGNQHAAQSYAKDPRQDNLAFSEAAKA